MADQTQSRILAPDPLFRNRICVGHKSTPVYLLPAAVSRYNASVPPLFATETAMELVLAKNDIVTLDGDQSGLQLHCRSGHLWLTQAGDSRDHLLAPGQHHTIARRGRVVIWALAPATLQTCSASAPAPAADRWHLHLGTSTGC